MILWDGSHSDIVDKSKGILKPDGMIMVHRPEEHFMPEKIGNLTRCDQRIYGRSIVDFYKY